jgi:gliding motility-associated-like protein
VTDDENPSITCPSDITVSNDNNACNADVVVPAPVAADNCTVASVINDYNGTANASDNYPVGTTTILWTVTDIHGNVSTCTMSVTVVDDEAPEITCPSDITVDTDLDVCEAFVTVPAITNVDECGILSIVNDFTGTSDASGVYPIGNTTVVWTVTDIHNNVSTCSMTITVVDNQVPYVTCPSDITVNNDLILCGAQITVDQPVVSDNCGIATIVNNYNNTDNATDFYNVGTTTVIWTITDIHGNVSTCSMNITVIDNENPAITCPADITVSNDDNACDADITVTQPIISDNCLVATLVNDYNGTDNASDNYPVGTTLVTWTVTDIYGNNSSCTMSITVVDDEAPEVTCPSDITVNNDLGVCEALVTIDLPISSDECGILTVVNDYNGTENASDVYPVGTTTVTWTITDINGNVSNCSTNITVVDNEVPSITCPADITQQNDLGVCGALVIVPVPVIFDNCGTSTLVNNYTGTDNATAVYPVGTTTLCWTITDIYGNSTTCCSAVTVNDAEIPSIFCPENVSITNEAGVCNAVVIVDAPVVSDNCGIASVVNNINGTTNASGTYPVGTTIVVWTVTDIHGNINTCEMTVTVLDSELPSITCPEDITVNNDQGECGAVLSVPTPFATDNCSISSITNDYTGTSDATGFYPSGTTTVNWTALDEAGNSISCTMTITVVDIENPVVTTCTEDVVVANDPNECGAIVIYDMPIVVDNCFLADTTLITGLASGSLFPLGTTEVTYEYSDANGNLTSCTFTVTVEDTQLPGILCPDAITVNNDPGMCGANVNYPLPIYTDNCQNAIMTLVSGPAQGEYFELGTTSITYQVTDDSGNIFECSFDVIVVDAEAPIIVCPENITQTDPIVNYELPVYSDNCTATIEMIDGLESGDVFPLGYTTIIFVATDLAGNTDTCSFEILVNTPPVAVDDFTEYLEEDDVITIDVIENDYDLDGDSIFVTGAWAEYGTVVLGPNNTLLYEALEGWCGQDTLTYVLSDINLATDTAIVIIDIECFVDLIIPQGISPNGDGVNDYFEIIGLEDYPKNTLSVFNRWGHKVYEQNNYTNEWDGKSQSSLTIGNGLLPKGTYFYVLDVGPDLKPVKGYVFLNY